MNGFFHSFWFLPLLSTTVLKDVYWETIHPTKKNTESSLVLFVSYAIS